MQEEVELHLYGHTISQSHAKTEITPLCERRADVLKTVVQARYAERRGAAFKCKRVRKSNK